MLLLLLMMLRLHSGSGGLRTRVGGVMRRRRSVVRRARRRRRVLRVHGVSLEFGTGNGRIRGHVVVEAGHHGSAAELPPSAADGSNSSRDDVQFAPSRAGAVNLPPGRHRGAVAQLGIGEAVLHRVRVDPFAGRILRPRRDSSASPDHHFRVVLEGRLPLLAVQQ